MWVFGALVSALLLGVYDVFKKNSLQNNAVLPVLFLSTFTSALLFLPLVIFSQTGVIGKDSLWYILPQVPKAHIFFFIKSIIVGTSWVLAYFAMKHLPLTIVSPIRSSGPIWTLLGAIFIFGEKMSLFQWVGLTVTISFYYLFSQYGKKEGISFKENKWVMFMVLSTIVGSISSLYDKFLVAHFNRIAMQCWFSIYMAPITGLLALIFWYPKRKIHTAFNWKFTILLIGLTLTTADFIYFWAIAQKGSLISIISTIRRGSVIVSFTTGAILFKEKNIKIKALLLAGILAGIALIIFGSH